VPLTVIGAGAPRTGTLSLKHALDQLGFGPCCHVREMLKPENAWRGPLWERFYDGKSVDWEEVFRGFNATMDWPGSCFWPTLARAYPSAKVILTVRDRKSWLHSLGVFQEAFGMIPTVAPGMAKMIVAAAKEIGMALAPPSQGSDYDMSYYERFLIDQEKYNVPLVRREIAPERLLVFNVEQGWGPLCEFLGTRVPNTPFPHENTRDDFLRFVRGAGTTG
jgi:hypothetical protein